MTKRRGYYLKPIKLGLMLSCICYTLCQSNISYAQDNKLRLGLTKTRLYIQTERVDEAFNELNALSKTYPNNPSIALARAEAYLHIGRWRKALELLRKTLERHPNNLVIKQRKKEIEQDYAPFILLNREIELTGNDAMEQIVRVQTEQRINKNNTLGAKLEQNRVDINRIRRVNGIIEDVNTRKNKAEMYVKYEPLESYNAQVSIYAAENTIGIGGNYSWIDTQGITKIEATLNKPDWDFLESVIDQGSKDTLKLSREQRLKAGVKTVVSTGVNRYNIKDNDGAANTAFIDMVLSYALPKYTILDFLGKDAYFSVNYYLDAEYAFDTTEKTDSENIRFQPIPFISTEVHTINLSLTKEIVESLMAGIYGGYSVDRLGEAGPSIGGYIEYQTNETILISAYTSHNISTQNSGDKSQLVGLNLKWIF